MKFPKTLSQFILCLVIFGTLSNLSFAQWTIAGDLSDFEFQSFSVVDSNVVWVAGGFPEPKIYRTVNGGMTWNTIPTNGLPFYLQSVSAKDSLTAYVADNAGSWSGGNAGLYKTTNAGVNWILIDTTGGSSGYFAGIVFSKTSPEFGIAQGDPSTGLGGPYNIFKTSNGGNNWIRTIAPNFPNSYGTSFSVFAIDHLFYGFITIDISTFICDSYITSNGGSSWYRGNVQYPGAQLTDLTFSDNKKTGIMLTDSLAPFIKRTTDGGISWHPLNTNSDVIEFGTANWIAGTNTVFAGAFIGNPNQSVLRCDDGGLTWTSQNTPSLDEIVSIDYKCYNNIVFTYAISYSTGEILKSRQIVNPVGIQQTGNLTPSEFSLHQNYPNPFNPVTNLKFEIHESGFVSLIIYDNLGKEVATLVNSDLNPGTYKYDFNASDLPSGVYYYRLEGNDFTETKSMMLLK